MMQPAAPQKSAHFILQGKGGVGKSLIASILAQYFLSHQIRLRCIDTDPVNRTFASYLRLEAAHLDLMADNKIDERRFDQLLEQILTEPAVYVIDNGASTFVALSAYLAENRALALLVESGYQVYVHTVITGGQALLDTLQGFDRLAKISAPGSVVVWLNEFFGPIVRDGKSFTDMRALLDNQDKVRGILRLAKRNEDTFGRDMVQMASRHMTFEEVQGLAEFSIMAKQRIRLVQRDLYQQLDATGL